MIMYLYVYRNIPKQSVSLFQ